jgi:hypothetical protein
MTSQSSAVWLIDNLLASLREKDFSFIITTHFRLSEKKDAEKQMVT